MRNMACKYRIYPDREQQVLFGKTFGCCRFVYNQMLSEKKAAYEKGEKIPQVTPARYKSEYDWLKEVDSLALANVQLHLEAAFRRYFDHTANCFPKFKSKHGSRQSYTTNMVNGNIRIEGTKDRRTVMSLTRSRPCSIEENALANHSHLFPRSSFSLYL